MWSQVTQYEIEVYNAPGEVAGPLQNHTRGAIARIRRHAVFIEGIEGLNVVLVVEPRGSVEADSCVVLRVVKLLLAPSVGLDGLANLLGAPPRAQRELKHLRPALLVEPEQLLCLSRRDQSVAENLAQGRIFKHTDTLGDIRYGPPGDGRDLAHFSAIFTHKLDQRVCLFSVIKLAPLGIFREFDFAGIFTRQNPSDRDIDRASAVRGNAPGCHFGLVQAAGCLEAAFAGE